jgi:hypothetical protein
MAALHGVPPPSQYTGGDDWIMDTGASSHMANNPGILVSSPPPLQTSIIVGNDTPLPVHRIGSTAISTQYLPLKLNNILISPHLIKNLILVRALTRDNLVFIIFDPFGFSIKDFRTGTTPLRCDSTSKLYPLRISLNNSSKSGHSFLASHNNELWQAASVTRDTASSIAS